MFYPLLTFECYILSYKQDTDIRIVGLIIKARVFFLLFTDVLYWYNILTHPALF